MHSINIWNKFNICRSKTGLIILLLCIFTGSQAQIDRKKASRYKIVNLPNYDIKKIHYGFFIGINHSRFITTHSSYYAGNNEITYAQPEGSTRFSLGFLANIRLSDRWAFRLVPAVGFYDRYINYEYTDAYVKKIKALNNNIGPVTKQASEATFLELAMLFKYKALRRENYRFYYVGGIKPAINAGGKKSTNRNNMTFSTFDFSVDYGAGVDLYFPMFKFAPEIRFSHGLNNLLVLDNNLPQTKALKSVFTHTVTLYLFFE